MLVWSFGTAQLLGQASINPTDMPPCPIDLPRSSPPKPAFSTQLLPDPSAWASTPIDWTSSHRAFPQWVTNTQTGEVTVQNHQVIEVGNGLNYIDSNGAWQQSQDLIELTPDGGAAAVHLPNKVFFGPSLSTNSGFRLVTMSNLVFTTCPTAIYFYDPTTGKEQLLASLQNGIAGKLMPPNRILYSGAFQSDAIQADLRVTVTKGAMECDTVITHQLKVSPQTFSMEPSTTLLQVRNTWSIPRPPDVSVGQTANGALADSYVDFGDFHLGRGRAFAWDGAIPTDTNTPARIDLGSQNPDVSVGKAWQIGNPSMLTESVLWTNVEPKLSQLPLMASSEHRTIETGKTIELACATESKAGFVLDPIIVTGTGDYTFDTYNGANTFWLQSSASFGGTVTFNPGCIIKRAPGATLTVSASATTAIICNGTCSNPSIITIQDDNMYGEQTGTSCAAIDNAVALITEQIGGSVVGMNIRYAWEAVEFLGGMCCADNRNFKDSTIEACQTGLFAVSCNVTITNSAISSVPWPTTSYNNGTFSGSWGSTCGQVSLHGAVVAGMQALASGKTASSAALQLYNYSGNYPTNFPISYNTNCWIYGLKGLTAICVSNSAAYWYQLGSVLITPKHILTAAHIGFDARAVMRFIGKSGAHYVAVVTDSATIQPLGFGDVAVLTLDRDLPSDVETMKVLPEGALNKMTFDIGSANTADSCLSKYLPCIGLDQWKGAYAEDLFWWDPSGRAIRMRGSAWFPSWMNGYEPWGGDSGHPILAVINNELVLVGCWSTQDINPIPFPTLGQNTTHSYNGWFGFAFSSTNTLVVDPTPTYDEVGRWNENTNTCNQTHTLAFFNSLGTNLTSISVTALQSNAFFSTTNLTNASYPFNGVLLLPGASNTNYYFLSQEFQGGDYWYGWPGTSIFTPRAIT